MSSSLHLQTLNGAEQKQLEKIPEKLQMDTKQQSGRDGVDLVFGHVRTRQVASAAWWQSDAIKVDAPPYNVPDGFVDSDRFERDLHHEHPLRGGTNRVYVQIHNNGDATAHNIQVKLFYVEAAVGLPALPGDIWEQFPNDPVVNSPWHVIHTPSRTHHTITQLEPDEVIILKWDWPIQPTQATHYNLLALMACDEAPILITSTIVDEMGGTNQLVALKSSHLVEAPRVDYFPWRQLIFLDIHNARSTFQFYDLSIRSQDFAKQGKFLLLLPPLYTKRRLEDSYEGLFYEDGVGFDELVALHGDHWELPAEIDPYHLYQITGRPQATIHDIGLESGARARLALVLEAPTDAQPDSYHRFEVVQQLRGETVGGISYALHVGQQALRQPSTQIRIVLEKIRILDKHEPFFRGQGEFSFVANVSVNGDFESAHSTRLPTRAVYKLSDKPGDNEQMINACIFEGPITNGDSLEFAIVGQEHDWPDADDLLAIYQRRFSGALFSWLGSYRPGDESQDPEAMPDWQVWYRIEAIQSSAIP